MTTQEIPANAVGVPDHVRSDVGRPNKRVYEASLGVAVIAVGAAVYFATDGIDVAREGQSFGPRWWPTALAVTMVVIGLILIVQAILSRVTSDEPPVTMSGGVALTATLSLIVVYGFAWQYFDFRVVTVVLLAGLVAISGGRGLKALIVFPLVTTFILWAVFGLLLQVPL
ncbi:tripartite tricarboxylate transporter TctB family protein [Rhodococcus sp. BP-252]|uniref:tripartite tricarboxylate transporter TctB family protein n=1 Tax=unclassified Rhodococcus (in: high G+C Gram-positive bacteria) TaxID=192944 RepID=UPI001C9B50C5|nr:MULTISPECIES: tripartite tricarboxylate transporter TctB family protein [unclassified Rhodococcus (in: high G+C Gram-positive bacteria)]MBY6414328.1 tripartite tricarboxylate transporter TctB family protein [Rhodococcus sp. BP-320]MBY6419098.1 tripartite tricarboxylate transporter TctB family protein [Rhodococcus sp. BP-321]MBY6423811.1 tripartite tricarboxylate transporter TctB family protein [Rhodococcus sp. BP-324]MBY6429195.1 tripartite tricarboxylate transporter TctB family protein [Rho